MKVHVFNIDWDVDTISDLDNLPESFYINVGDEESLIDTISDRYGFCVISCQYDIIEDDTKGINKPDFEITEHMFNLGYLFIEDHNDEYHVEYYNCALVPIINKIRIGELGSEENALVFAFYKEDKDNHISDDNLISIIRFNLEKNEDILDDIKEWANTHKNVEYLGRAGE